MAEDEKKFSKQMLGKTVVTKSGKRFGEVGNITFETRTGELIQVILKNPTGYAQNLDLEKDGQGDFTLPFSAGCSVPRPTWKQTTAFRSSPSRAMLSTTPPPKQYPMAETFEGSTCSYFFKSSIAAVNRAFIAGMLLMTWDANLPASLGWSACFPLPYISTARAT